MQYYAVFNDALGKDANHIFNAFMGLKMIHDTPVEQGKLLAIPANWSVGKEPLKVDTVKDIGKL